MRLLATLLLGLLALGAARATTYEVKIGAGKANVYAPDALPSLHVGDAVKFTWVDGTHPTVSDSSPEAWPAFTLSATNSTQTLTFTKAGTYPYHCSAHAYQTSTGAWAGMVGTITVQAALATAAQAAPALGFSVYPNPAHGQTTVQVSAPTGPDYQLRLSNVLGGEVRRLPVRPEAMATDGLPLDLTNLPPGLYFCSLLAGEKTVATKRLTVL